MQSEVLLAPTTLRFSTSRHGTRDEAYIAGEEELKGLLAHLGRPEYIVTSEQRSDEKNT